MSSGDQPEVEQLTPSEEHDVMTALKYGRLSLAPLIMAVVLLAGGCGGGAGDTSPNAPDTLSGKVTLNGSGLAGVTMTLSGTGVSSRLITNSTGNYGFSGVLNGSYIITPTMNGYAFTPSSMTVTVNNGVATGLDFTVIQTGSATIQF